MLLLLYYYHSYTIIIFRINNHSQVVSLFVRKKKSKKENCKFFLAQKINFLVHVVIPFENGLDPVNEDLKWIEKKQSESDSYRMFIKIMLFIR